ncbi:trypsin-like peptidase domain-containing protein [Nicoliella spurrieriana]|uniref:Trypsin-like peptidase domain-containing protein n=1 Tax=Nicoliella spurrieriana TaxID=2925830 RepID=A0A976RT15_9LACO|nr:trypsin-like peptidase domain-containing protein [Nicoliella spurrieriana]UQS87263.1 trypsin-like peptidase domain-containing protein [Nicoliella spurrieriana]
MKTSLLFKVGLTSLVAGLLGGGIAYGGISYFQNDNPITGEVAAPTGSNAGGTTSSSNLKVNVQTQAEKAFKDVKNSVVSVINLQRVSSSQDSFASLFGSGGTAGKSSLQTTSEGSGVIYKTSGDTAYIVTNNHVVSGSNALQVLLSNGQKMEAKIVGRDSVTDLAVIKISSSKVTQVASFGDSDNIKVGETALAIGSPLGTNYASSLTQGIISAKNRQVPLTTESGQTTGNYASVIQTDAAINPGNSGGPLINLAGQVIGINSMKLSSDTSGTSVEGIGFAIPSNEVIKIINQLIKSGKIVRPALGIEYVDLANVSSNDRKSVLKLPDNVTTGAVVMSVNSNSPASNAGLKKYDVITELGGKKITNQDQIRNILYTYKLGDTVSLTYYRGEDKKTTKVKLTEESSQLKVNSSSESSNK